MANSFLENYRFNTEIAPDYKVLMRTEKKSRESFQEYAQRWHELAAQVQPPMMENEMIKWFIDKFKPPYYEKMISTQVTHFPSLIPIGEHIDEGFRSKKIMDPESLNSMVEQQVKKMTGHKAKEAYLHIVDNELLVLQRWSRLTKDPTSHIIIYHGPGHALPCVFGQR